MKQFIFPIILISFFSCKENKAKNSSGNDDNFSDTGTIVYTDRPTLDDLKRTSDLLAYAGPDQLITGNSVTLNAKSNRDDIIKWQWEQEKGPLISIANNTNQKTTVSNIPFGEYRFRITITDNKQNTSFDTCHVSKKNNILKPKIPAIARKLISGDSGVVSSAIPQRLSTRSNLLMISDFDNSDPFENFYKLTAASAALPYSIATNTSIVHSGSASCRFELRKTDPVVGYDSRSELSFLQNDGTATPERWFGCSIYLGDDYVTDQLAEILHQVHSANSESPCFSFGTKDGVWMAWIATNGGGKTVKGPAYNKGAWTNIVYHAKLSTGSDGLIEMWVNGTLMFTFSGQTQYSNVSGANLYRIGIYKWGYSQGLATNTSQRVAYFDDVRMGNEKATYNDVAP